jgi:Ran GTPase-activating protein (RanGAP) involved in mRNA processing and transport
MGSSATQDKLRVEGEKSNQEWNLICQTLASITDVILTKTNLPSSLFDAIQKCNRIQRVHVSEVQLSLEDLRRLIDALAVNPLESLSLEDSTIGDEGASILAKSFHSSDLESLTLNGCEIGDEGICALLPIIKKVHNLALERNLITNDGSESIRQVLESENSMQQLLLGDNELGDTGIATLAEAFASSHCSIKELDVSKNKFGSLGWESLVKNLPHAKALVVLSVSNNKLTSQDILSKMKQIPKSMQLIDIKGCPIDPHVVQELNTLLIKNREEWELEQRVQFASFAGCTASFGRRAAQ